MKKVGIFVLFVDCCDGVYDVIGFIGDWNGWYWYSYVFDSGLLFICRNSCIFIGFFLLIVRLNCVCQCFGMLFGMVLVNIYENVLCEVFSMVFGLVLKGNFFSGLFLNLIMNLCMLCGCGWFGWLLLFMCVVMQCVSCVGYGLLVSQCR